MQRRGWLEGIRAHGGRRLQEIACFIGDRMDVEQIKNRAQASVCILSACLWIDTMAQAWSVTVHASDQGGMLDGRNP